MGRIDTYQIKCDQESRSTGISKVHGTCYAYKIARGDVGAFLKSNRDLDTCGVYLLLADSGKGRMVYVGEAESVANRLKQHLKHPPYEEWEEVIAFIGGGSASDWEKGSIKYMEHCLYEQLIDCASYAVKNGNTPKKSKVNLYWVWDEQVEEMKSLVPFLGHPRLFLKIEDNADGAGDHLAKPKVIPMTFEGDGTKEYRQFGYTAGGVASSIMRELYARGALTDEDFRYLISPQASSYFKMGKYPVLKVKTGESGEYKGILGHFLRNVQFSYNGREYILSAEFYPPCFKPLMQWAAAHGFSVDDVRNLCEKYKVNKQRKPRHRSR